MSNENNGISVAAVAIENEFPLDDSYVESEKIRLIYLQSLLSNITIFLIAILFFVLLEGKVSQDSLTLWFFSICTLSAYRLILWYRYKKASHKKSVNYWFMQYTFATGLMGLSWCYIYMLGYGHIDSFVIFSIFMLCFGIIGAALGVLSASLPMFFIYIIPQVLTLGYMLLSYDRFEAKLLILALCIYTIMMSFFAKNVNQYILRSIKLQHKLNQEIHVRENLINDRTKELIATNEEISYQASHDSLTNLINRREFEKRLVNVIKSSHEHNVEHALLYIDLDQFKIINDSCGHMAGDELLRQISSVLLKPLRSRDTLARLGGDEFGVLLENCPLEKASEIALILCESVKEFKFVWENQPFDISASIGVVPISHETQAFTDAMSSADLACYAAKDSGRNCVHIADAEDTEVVNRKGELKWLSQLKAAIEQDQFVIFFQKIASIEPHHETEHVEILIRLKDGDKIIPPGAFIPAAERYHMMPHIDRWVIDKVFKQYGEQQSDNLPARKCTINLCGASIGDDSLIDFIINRQKQYLVSPENICFEITETAAIANLSKATRFIDQLKALGYSFALDDFGSGMSSFAYLKNLSVNYLKIDGAFIKDIVDDPIDFAMVKSINEIGHAMGLKTIAEFVENQSILDKLKSIGIDYSQGYHIHKPEIL